ncbi:MAG: hypothetical protein J6Q80_03400 [Lentisphaeria bacterium]|nr:hypothetical protein [Lentisphaeria bacterium]
MVDRKNFCVAGIGGAGCRIVSYLAKDAAADTMRFIAIDTDENGLGESLLSPEQTILAGSQWRNGKGTGGNYIDGQRAVSHERKNIEQLLAGADMLLICAGLGGGTASGGIPILLSCASNMHIPVISIVTTPFAVEGVARRKSADQSINEMLRIADAVIPVSNDLLFAGLDPATPLAEAFRISAIEMARTVKALSTILCSGNLLNADFSDFSALLRRKKSNCALGIGVINSNEVTEFRAEKLFSQLLESPLLGGASRLCDADAVIFTLSGGPELSISDAQSVFKLASGHIGKKTKILVGASVDDASAGTLQFTALAVNFEENEIKADASGSRRKNKTPVSDSEDGQLTLPLSENEYNFGIMKNTIPVRWKGEELDVPTFQRKGLAVDSGKDELF